MDFLKSTTNPPSSRLQWAPKERRQADAKNRTTRHRSISSQNSSTRPIPLLSQALDHVLHSFSKPDTAASPATSRVQCRRAVCGHTNKKVITLRTMSPSSVSQGPIPVISVDFVLGIMSGCLISSLDVKEEKR